MKKYYLVSLFSGVYHYNEVYTGLDLTDYLLPKLEANPTWFDNHAITGSMEISAVEYHYLYDKLRMDDVSPEMTKGFPLLQKPEDNNFYRPITDKPE